MHKQDAILHNISLKPYNTFGIDVKAKNFIAVSSLKELKEVFLLKEYPTKFILGGGSNMLLTKDVDDLVVNINLKGKEIISESGNTTLVKVKAGENWHEFVLWALSQNLGGVENLSLIPGNVGTAPIQNIGAYGVELKDVFYSCEALNTKTLEVKPFSKEECNFGYRDSYFKRNKGEYIITSVTFKLTNTDHKLNISYGAIEAELKNKKGKVIREKQIGKPFGLTKVLSAVTDGFNYEIADEVLYANRVGEGLEAEGGIFMPDLLHTDEGLRRQLERKSFGHTLLADLADASAEYAGRTLKESKSKIPEGFTLVE